MTHFKKKIFTSQTGGHKNQKKIDMPKTKEKCFVLKQSYIYFANTILHEA